MRAALGSISTPYKRTRRNQNDALIGGRVIGQTAINNETLLTLLIFCRSLDERQIAESLVLERRVLPHLGDCDGAENVYRHVAHRRAVRPRERGKHAGCYWMGCQILCETRIPVLITNTQSCS